MYNALAFVKSISNFFDELTWWQTELIFLLRIAIGGLLGLAIGIARAVKRKRAWARILPWDLLRPCLPA